MWIAFALVSVAPALVRPGHVTGDGVDSFGTVWFYWWIRTCVEHLGDPSFTRLFFWPLGKDILAHTGNNFVDAVWSVPFQWVLGPLRYQPVFVAFLLVGNAATFRPLARYVLGDEDRASVATLLWLVNPYACFEVAAGRPTQACLWFVPAAILAFLRCAREPGWHNAILLGVSVALAGWTYWFVGYFLVFLLVPLAVIEWRESRDRAGTLRRWGFAALLTVILVLPAAIPMADARATGAVPGVVSPDQSIFSAPLQLGNNVASELHGLLLMEVFGAPLLTSPAWALPLAAAVVVASVTRRHRRWIVAMACVLIFAFGTTIRWGDQVVGISVPYMILYRYLPFFDRLWFPYRFVAVAFVPACLLIAAALPAGRKGIVGGALLAALGLAGQSHYSIWPFPVHDIRCPPMLAALRFEGGTVVTLPFGIQNDTLTWQTQFQLPLLGGMGESAEAFWPEGYAKVNNNRFFRALRAAVIDHKKPRNYVDYDRKVFEKRGVRWVVYRRDLDDPSRAIPEQAPFSLQAVADITEVVGHPPAGVDGSVVLWDLQGRYNAAEPFVATQQRLAARTWTLGHVEAWSRALSENGRTGRPTTPPAKQR